jgi:GH25 family lysozyme M1 (1,4-beta-N-acetylmuramidase)
MMHGIDISHWQKGIDLSKIKADFIIAKATEGIAYTDPCFKQFMETAEKTDRCMGFYHFARPEKNSAKAEAIYFIEKAGQYFHKGIPILDWESEGKSNVQWAKEWLDYVYQLTEVRPLIYMSQAVVNQFDWSRVANANYGLWVAKYRDYGIDRNYDMTNAGNKPTVKHWSFYAMWQWTSSGRLDNYNANLDLDVFYGDRDAWLKYAGVKETPTYTVQEGDTLTSIAQRLDINVDYLAEKNNLIKVGQVLKI